MNNEEKLQSVRITANIYAKELLLDLLINITSDFRMKLEGIVALAYTQGYVSRLQEELVEIKRELVKIKKERL